MSEKTVPEGGCFLADELPTKVLRVFAYSLVMSASLIGNAIVVAIVWRSRRMQTSVNLFIVNMAVADLVVSLYTPRAMAISYAGYQWLVSGTFGAVLCKISMLFNQVPMIASVLTVVAISFDRFAAVVYPLQTIVTKRRCKIAIVSTWVVAFAVRLPTGFAVELRYNADKLYCYLLLDDVYGAGTARVFYQFTFVAIFCVPFALIVALYAVIIFVLKRGRGLGVHMDSAKSQERIRRRREATNKKVLRMITAVVIAFWLCWCYYYIHLILYAYGVPASCELLFVRSFLAHFNSALNPCLYVIFSENYRKGFWQILSRVCGCLRRARRRKKTPPPQRQQSTGWNSEGSISIKFAGEIREMSELQA